MSEEGQAPLGEVTDDERNLALLMHLLALFTGFVGPLIVWLVKKDDSTYLDQHGKEALNFQISALIYFLVGMVITVVTCGVGFFLLLALVVLMWVACILAAMQGHRGDPCSYPLTIRLLK